MSQTNEYKFTLITQQIRSGHLMAENYTNTPGKFGRANVNSLQRAKTYGRQLIHWFNETLRPGESERKFITCLRGHRASEFYATGAQKEKVKFLESVSNDNIAEIVWIPKV